MVAGGSGGGGRGEQAAGDSPTWSRHAHDALRDLVLHPDVLVGAAERHLARAALLLGAAAALLDSAGGELSPSERSRLGALVTVLSAGLTDAAWAPLWAEGRVLALNLLPAPDSRPPAASAEPLAPAASGRATVTLPPESLRRTLTGRERQVLRLVADGLSNEQIAVTLVTEKRTVESHLTHIGSKLRLRRRAVIAHARDILDALAPEADRPG